MSGLKIEADGIARVATNLKEFGERASDAKPAMRKVRTVIEAGNRRNFETSGAYLGESWDQLAPGTLARKLRKGQSMAPLHATGALERSLSGGKGRRGGATKTMARAGTSVWYGIFAQSGTKTAPRRPITGFAARDVAKSLRIIEKFLMTGEVF
jgi:phage gpG-like protein